MTEATARDRSAWRGPELADDPSWIYTLSAGEIAEIDAALRHVQALGLPVEAMTRDHFPLPGFAATVARHLDEIAHGRGFVVVRGLPMARYSDDEVGLIFYGIGTHLGVPLRQNPQGDLLGHVFDQGRPYGQIDVRGYETNAHLPFHTDGCEIVGLLCLRAARAGGLSSLVSSTAVHAEIARTHPELLPPLYRGFHYIRREAALGDTPVTPQRIPVFGVTGGVVSGRLVANQIKAGAKKLGRPLEPLESQALDLVAELSYSARFRLDMDLIPGDMQLCNNYTVMHSRTGFEDWPEPHRRRHMLRLWLGMREPRPLADGFPRQFGYRANDTIEIALQDAPAV
ncbi:MAG TPA: TauD/TfdA family dioxygenase [Candidatus Sulfotelmatobacter sp.]|nr:TauD/TfdA family dioxygenase [Candidatus Sulfotelmatobacter sp.]